MSGRLLRTTFRTYVYAELFLVVLAGCATAPATQTQSNPAPADSPLSETTASNQLSSFDEELSRPELSLQPPTGAIEPSSSATLPDQLSSAPLPEPRLPAISRPRIADQDEVADPPAPQAITSGTAAEPRQASAAPPTSSSGGRIFDGPIDTKLVGRRPASPHLTIIRPQVNTGPQVNNTNSRSSYELHDLPSLSTDPSWPSPWPVIRAVPTEPTDRIASVQTRSTDRVQEFDQDQDQNIPDEPVVIAQDEAVDIAQSVRPEVAAPPRQTEGSRSPAAASEQPRTQVQAPAQETLPKPAPTENTAQIDPSSEPGQSSAGAPVVTMPIENTMANEAETVASPPSAEATSDVEIATIVDELHISLPGVGWIYLGESEDGVLSLLRKTIRDDGSSTLFVFRTPDAGQYNLVFQKQDLSTGLVHEEIVSLSPTDFDSDRAADAPIMPEDRDQQVVETPPAVNEVESDESSTESAPETSLVTDEPSPETPEEALQMADELVAAGAYGAAISLLEGFLSEATVDGRMDPIYFRLAALYERASESRDLRKAREYYRLVVSDFPFSLHWEDASARDEYLTRHFFEIR